MTREEYIRSLVDQNIPGDKMFELVRQWEIDNPETEKVEEVKTEVVADQAGAAVTTTTEEASDTASESEDGSSVQSSYNPFSLNSRISSDEFLSNILNPSFKNNTKLDAEELNKQFLEQPNYTTRVQIAGQVKEYTVSEIQDLIDKGELGNVKSVDEYIKKMRGKAGIKYYTEQPAFQETSDGEIIPFGSAAIPAVITSKEIQLAETINYDPQEVLGFMDQEIWFDENDNYYKGGYNKLNEYISSKGGEYYDPQKHGKLNKKNLKQFEDKNVWYFDVNGSDHEVFFDANNKEPYTGVHPLNLPLLRKAKTIQLREGARNKFNFENEKILEIGEGFLTEEELYFKELNEKYLNAEGEDKIKIGKEIEEIADDENFGKKLYDPNTGDLVDYEKANIETLDLFQQATNLAETSELDELTNGLASNYYEVNGLITDVLKMNDSLEKNPFSDFSGSSQGGSKGLLGLGGVSFKLGAEISDDQLNLLKEFQKTGVMPVGLKKLPGKHPLSNAFNKAFDKYLVVNKAIAINRDPLTTETGIGGEELIDASINMFGGDITTDNEARNLWVDGFQESGLEFVRPEDMPYNLERNIGQEAALTFPHLAEFAAEIFFTRKLTGNSLNKFANVVKSKSVNWKLLKNSPMASKVFKTTVDAVREGSEFGLATAAFDDPSGFGESFVFGTALGYGNPIYRQASKWLNKGLTRKLFSPVTNKLMLSDIYRGTTTAVGSGFAGGATYQLAGIMTNPSQFFEDLRNNNTNFVKTQAVETIKMVALGRLSKGIKGLDGVKRAFMNDIVLLGSKGRSSASSKAASKFFGIENELIEKPQESSEKNITDAAIDKIQEVAESLENKEITEQEAKDKLKEIKDNEQSALNQLAVNVAYDVVKGEKAKNNNLLPTDAQMYVISDKLRKGEPLTEQESSQLYNLPKEAINALITKNNLNIDAGSSQAKTLDDIYVRNSFIQHQLNGGGLFYTPRGISFSKPGEFNVPVNSKLRNETYEFLNKRMELDFSLAENQKLQKKENLLESEKIELKNKEKELKTEIEDYANGGNKYEEIQKKIQEENDKLLIEDTERKYNLPGGKSKKINNVQDFQDAYDAWGLKPKNVKEEIAIINPITKESFINMDVAKKVRNINPETHEAVHKIGIIPKDSKGLVTQDGIKLIDDVLENLSDNQRKILEEEVKSRYDINKPKEEWYEENITVLSELINSKKIDFSKPLGESLLDMVPFFKKKLPNLDAENVTGEQVFKLIEGFAKNKKEYVEQAEQFARENAKPGEKVSSEEVVSAASAAKKNAQILIEKLKDGQKINQKDLFKENLAMAADALKFDVKKGTILQKEFESFAGQYFPGIIRRYKPESGNQYSTFFYNNMRPKAQKFYESLEVEAFKTSIDALKDKGREIEDVVEETKIEESENLVDPFKGMPEGFKEKFYETQRNILDKAIKDGVDIGSKKYKKNLALTAFSEVADMFGIPVSRLSNPKDNLRKKENLEIQRFIAKNPEQFLKLFLPGNMRVSVVDSKVGDKKIKSGGEPMGIPGNVRKVFYEETGEVINGNKQYRLKPEFKGPNARQNLFDALGIEPGNLQGFNPRSDKAQLLKGVARNFAVALSNKAIRDITQERINEGSVSESEGMRTIGAGFDSKPFASESASKKAPTLNEQINLFLEQNGFEQMEKPGSLESSKKQRDLILNAFADKFGSTSENLIRWLSGGGLKPSTAKKRNFGFLGGKTENTLQEIADNPKYGIDSKEYREAEEILMNEEFFTMPGLKAELANEITSRGLENAVSKEEARLIKLAIGPQNFGKLENNKKVYEDLQKGKDLIFDKFREIAKIEDGKYMPELMSMLYHSNANNHPFRNLATVEGLMLGLDTKGKENREEHVFQYGNFAVAMGKALTASDKSYQGFKDWSKKNYYQLVLDKEQRLILDQPTLNVNRFTGEAIEGYSPKAGMHPLLGTALAKAIETGDYSKVPDVRLRYANEYFSANLNKLGREVKQADGTYRFITDAEDFNITVDKPFQNNQSVINEQGRLAYQIMLSEKGYIKEGEPNYTTRETARETMNAFEAITPTKDGLVDQINKNEGGSNNFTNAGIKVITGEQNVFETRTADDAAKKARDLNKEKKSLTAVDADNTVLESKNKVIGTRPDGSKIILRTEEFGEQASTLEAEGVTFDFSDFMKIKKGKPAAYFKRLKEQYKQHGPENLFVVSARPPEFAEPMKRWLESNGVNIPVENIIGLADGAPQAKANWFLKKAAEGYNDFLFADDILANVKAVKNVIDQVDIKSEVQVQLSAKPKTFDRIFNENLELRTSEMSGQTIGADWTISAARAASEGRLKNKNMFSNFFMGYSAEDFNGLLYETLPSGKRGDAMYQFYNDNLIDPFNRAERRIESAKIAAASDFKALKSKLEKLPKSMNTETGIGNYSFGDAARVAVWTNQGMEIPGLSKRDQKKLNKFVSENGDLSVFVSEIAKMQKGKQYPKPKEDWISGTLSSDIMGEINKVNRKEYLQEWKENVSIIFSDNNKNKLRFAFGDKYVEALDDVLGRMESGNNRAPGGNRTVNNMLDWVNGSVGATMFLNTRSAALQTISSVNYINWGDNNIYRAGKAFANQKQYWKDFKTLFNSDYLINRREGLNINVAESEIAEASKKGGAKGAIAYLLNKGFVMTRGADSFAIAAGGATFYRNRVQSLIDGGMPKEMAEAQAMDAWRKISEENQQSSSAMRISQQQASGAGRLVLAYGNTPMQYSRIMKRAGQDLANNRGDWKTNVSKIVYYGAAQNLIFNALQNSLWTEAFDEDGDGNDKAARTINGMGDSLLKGLGIQGSAAIAIKNSLMTIAKENDKDSPEFRKAISDLFDFSPPLDTKIRKLNSAANTFSWEREEIANQGFNLNNPAYLATAQVVSATTNIPADRAIQKLNNVRQIFNKESENWQKVALALGWSSWDVGLGYYGVEEKVDQTPEMILKEKVNTMKKETSVKEQKDLLLKLGLTKQQIKALKYENERVKKILELQEKNKD